MGVLVRAAAVVVLLLGGCTLQVPVVTGVSEDAATNALNDADVHVRRAAARALADVTSNPHILVEALWDGDAGVRLEARRGLARLGHMALPALIDVASDTHLVLLRRRAVETLGEMGPVASPALPQLVGALHSSDALLRHRAASALARMGRTARIAAEELADCVAHDPSAGVRLRAAEALGAVGTESEAPVLEVALLSDFNPGVRENAARALGKLAVGTSRHALARALATDPQPRVRAAAAAGLGGLGDRHSDVIAGLWAASSDEDVLVRDAAEASLVSLGGPALNLNRDRVRAGPVRLSVRHPGN